MGKYKDYLIDFDYLEDEQIERIVFKKAIKSFIIKNKNIKNDYLEKFLRLVIPKSENDYWLFINDKDTYCNLKLKYEEYISSIQTLCEQEVNLYFSPVSYNGERKNKNALVTNCIYVDIDDVGVDISGFNKDDIISFLIHNYNVPEALLPNYVVKSGHGLHLYFITETCGNTPERVSYVSSITTYFHGDLACMPISHVVRVPLSFNVKNKKVKSELFEVNTSTDYSFERLNFFILDQEIVESYYKKAYADRAQKSNETRQKNKRTNPPKQTETEPKTKNKRTQVNSEPKLKESNNSIKCVKRETELILNTIPKPLYYKNYYVNGHTNYNLLLDLHNYFVRHKGNIQGYRNNFIFIYSNICKNSNITIEYCKLKLEPYITDDFEKEANRIIENTYKTNTVYKFTNFKIADLLNFDDYDIKNSYCAFSEERRIEATKQRNKRKNEKRKQKTQSKKDNIKNFVKQNASWSTKKLAKQLQISERTVQRIRKQIDEAETK